MLFETPYRGDMYYVDPTGMSEGSEQKAGRPAIIVSNDMGNANSSVVEVVYLTTQPKSKLPTHVEISSAPKPSIALCEQITTVSKDRLSNLIGGISKREMDSINKALEISLSLAPLHEDTQESAPQTVVTGEERGNMNQNQEFVQLKAERDTYKAMYDSLLSRLIK